MGQGEIDVDDLDATAALAGDVVELTVPGNTGFLGVVRTATAGLAARLGFSLDEIEDLRIAVDEACLMVLSLPGPADPDDALLTCRFQVSDQALTVAVSARVGQGASLPAEQSFAWRVLTAHVTSLSRRAEPGRATIELVKRRRQP